MADFNQINQFGSAKPVRSGEGTSCAECEAMLMDALDGTLSAKEKASFDLHIATCSECSQMLADAKRGASMLEMLRSPRPEPSIALLERILSQTSGTGAQARSAAPGVIAISAIDGSAVEVQSAIPGSAMPANVLPFRPRVGSRFNLKAIAQTMMQPRLAMTAAMAFFSITLTLNLTGVHLSDLRASDLTPSNLKHTFYHANASVTRYYTNLRVVYELESRVNEMKRGNDDENPPAAAKPDGKDGDRNQDQGKPRKTPKSSSGTSERRSPNGQQFKLAEYGRTPEGFSSPDQTAFSNTALAQPTNKSKESSKEGDLV